MKSKLHIGIIIILLALVSRFADNSATPNQQIVIEFIDSQSIQNDAFQTLETIQSKLNSIGVNDIQIDESPDGHFRITYHSKANVEYIRLLLSDTENYKLGHNSDNQEKNLPEKHLNKSFQLDISEIKKVDSKNDWDFDGVQIVEHNPKSDRFNNLKQNTSGYLISSQQISESIEIAVRCNNNLFIPNSNSYKIPEVRAGPMV